MNRFNQVNMSTSTRRFGLPQVVLLTGAFATAVLLAVVFRPAKMPTVELGSTVTAPAQHSPVVNGPSEREVAQAKLAEAMARFANAPTKEAEPPAPAPLVAAAVPVAPPLAPAPEPQIAAAPVAQPAALPATSPIVGPAPAERPRPLSDSDMRRLSDKASQAIRDGDIYGARLILERAIEGGDSDALLALAETYDPKGLARMNVKSVKSDPARARALYKQALDQGVGAARARLEALDR